MPAKLRSKGTLTVASDATYAPMEFIAKDGKTVIGVDADLAKALGTVMGLKLKVQNATFATIIPGINSGKYDVGMSSFTDTKAREKVVDFVTYFSAGTSFYVKTSGGPKITGGLSSLVRQDRRCREGNDRAGRRDTAQRQASARRTASPA